MSLHQNSGHCEYCQTIFNKYPDFNQMLRGWFESLQAAHPEAHISCAGRGRIDQEIYFQRKASKAHYGESSHNYNAAIDIFKMASNVSDMYEKQWFLDVIAPAITGDLDWYGKPGSKFYELPHVEVFGWENMAKVNQIKLVE